MDQVTRADFTSLTSTHFSAIDDYRMKDHWIYEEKDAIIYVGDPMCSWCYGMAPSLRHVQEIYPEKEFRIVVGGLRPNGTEHITEMANFLGHHWKEVQERSGQPFDLSVLEDSSIIVNTERACRAVVCMRTLNPALEFKFFERIQKAFYQEGKDLCLSETYTTIVKEFKVDTHAFMRLFESEEFKYETRADFQLAAEMGISGFPSVILRNKGELFLVANGYRSPEDLESIFRKVLSES